VDDAEILVDNLKAKVIVEQQLDVVVRDTDLLDLVELNEESDTSFQKICQIFSIKPGYCCGCCR
jgi:hypothetical protein